MKKKTETQRVNEWSKKKTKGYYLKLNLETDADIIRFLDSQPNKNGFLKSIIRDIM